jgi:hypothetical protein
MFSHLRLLLITAPNNATTRTIMNVMAEIVAQLFFCFGGGAAE